MDWWQIALIVLGALLLIVLIHDLTQTKHAILRVFPIIGHGRYFLIEVGPELRQYLVAQNREELPFNRSEREWIYRSAEKGNNYFGFGTDDQVYGIGYPIIKHATFTYDPHPFTGSKHDKAVSLPCAKVVGEPNGRAMPYRPSSIINVSAMSFGSLGKNAVSAINLGAKAAGAYHNTGEGGCSKYHRLGADVVWQIGTGYFGARDDKGQFNLDRVKRLVDDVPQIKMIEIKLSQGAKPGKGGVLPGSKVTAEIADARGVMVGQDCISPNGHSAFRNVDELLEFIERIAGATGRPVGIKSAIGHLDFWYELADKVKASGRGPDFITIDGKEGGTGAAPLAFADHVALPYRVAFPRVYRIFQDRGLDERITWIGSAKLGFGDRAIVAIALGADLVNVAREALLAIGCIQAQKCHTGNCPTGITTPKAWLQRGMVIDVGAERLKNYLESFRAEVDAMTHAAGYEHPGQFTPHDVEVSAGPGIFKSLYEIYGYDKKQFAPGKAPVLKMSDLTGSKALVR
ncbi:MAG: FMN-binding glutamate synthase family protein [Planctomycetes bacterium]|nr:FMN-binding glutamate synthase family protein [Planctomycetota bacterium]